MLCEYVSFGLRFRSCRFSISPLSVLVNQNEHLIIMLSIVCALLLIWSTETFREGRYNDQHHKVLIVVNQCTKWAECIVILNRKTTTLCLYTLSCVDLPV